MHARLHERLASVTKPGIIVDIAELDGYEGMAALEEDL